MTPWERLSALFLSCSSSPGARWTVISQVTAPGAETISKSPENRPLVSSSADRYPCALRRPTFSRPRAARHRAVVKLSTCVTRIAHCDDAHVRANRAVLPPVLDFVKQGEECRDQLRRGAETR
jgi:hypothetical protein